MERSEWSTLVDYLLSCVLKESLVAPVPLHQRSRWSVLPLSAESVLCGNDLLLPILPQLTELFADLEPLEGVFYGWPTVVVLDERRCPFIAPLFIRQLNAPDAELDGVPVDDQLPQLNAGLLDMKWFPAETLSAAMATVAGGLVGFGQAAAVSALARTVLSALGVPLTTLDPMALLDTTTMDDPWRPQEVGVFNFAMAFKGQLDAATRNLVKDLEWMRRARDWRDSAARFLFEEAPVPPASLPISAALSLNDAQETALSWSATAPLTVITGPPGTGKSQTVTAILADAWRRGETALLSSTNNTPVDDVIDSKAVAVDDALVLRTGNAEKRLQLGERLRELVAGANRRSADSTADDLTAAGYERHQLAAAMQQAADLAQGVLVAAVRRDAARSVLWSGHQPPPVDRDAMRRRAGRADRTGWKWLRRRRTRRLLALLGLTDPVLTARHVLDWLEAERTFDEAWRRLESAGTTQRDLLESFDDANRRWLSASTATVRNEVSTGLREGAEALATLAETLIEELPRREAMESAMRHVRGWATSALSTRPNFDCRAGAIDLVVIDEASQCNLAQVLPLAYRAKRLVIVGDPHQLSPVVTVAAAELRALAKAAGTSHEALVTAHYSYGQDSAFTAFAARFRPAPLLLDEHYRCHPEIIEYSNRHFYGGRLTVLTSVDRADGAPRGIEWHDIDGRTEPGRTGSSLNKAEADAVVEWVRQAGLPADRLGVVTPFRAQATRIRQLLDQAGAVFGDVRVGTAHKFQGGERDVMVFSTVISAGAKPGTVSWLENERNLINVAVSRAKQRLVVFGNHAELQRLDAKLLLGLADAAGRHHRRAADPTPAALTLHAALVARGLPATLGAVDEGYPLAISLRAVHGAGIDVEVDEFPDGDPRGRLQRQRAVRDANVRRLGWQVVRVPGWQAYLQPDSVVDHVQRLVTSGDA
ncbi:AAA domain-containing protein [Labedaea rhizosphaerae]|uniref:AAA domain-containing protein n=1 Tax=Labedaea rhizosphaerae TaxID=598644 RepID=A0A4R6S9Z6_LABRH|nr:AAA domain-containing protein [Labedaea rhizosphaerae]